MANTNGFDPVAWSIDGGRLPSDVLRLLAYAATGGAEGIAEATDCKVHQLTVPGPQIVIDAGGILVRNRSASVRNQTYAANGRLQSTWDVAPTGGSARSDLVVLRVKDPQFSPWGSIVGGGDPATFQYVEPFIVQNVPANTTTALSQALGYSAVELARIDIPASTTNITNAMIKDLRKLAQPKRWSFHQRYDTPDPSIDDTGAAPYTFERWPNTIAQASIFVPPSATRVIVRVDVTSIQIRTGNWGGTLRFKMTGGSPSTSIYTPETYINEQIYDGSRHSYLISGELVVPASMRGYTLLCNVESNKHGGGGFLRAEADAQVTVEATWTEVAE